jgi:hypothetical protein
LRTWEGQKVGKRKQERENRKEPRLNPPSANRKAVFNKVNIEEIEKREEVENVGRAEGRKEEKNQERENRKEGRR